MMSTLLRPAIAMIELIFALVIMGIVLMSAPQLVSLAQQSGYTSTQQEAIASVSSHMSMVLSRHWDNANVAQARPVTILTTATDAAMGLGPNSIPMVPPITNPIGARAGSPATSTQPRSFLPTDGTPAVASGAIRSEAGEVQADDIDDYDNTDARLRLAVFGGGVGTDDYIDKTFTMTTTVNYAADAPTNAANYTTNVAMLQYNQNIFPLPVIAGATSSVKWVRIVLNPAAGTAAELNKQITLSAFSCNIGGFDLDELAIR